MSFRLLTGGARNEQLNVSSNSPSVTGLLDLRQKSLRNDSMVDGRIFEIGISSRRFRIPMFAPSSRMRRTYQKLCNIISFIQKELSKKSYPKISHLENFSQKFYPNFLSKMYVTFSTSLYFWVIAFLFKVTLNKSSKNSSGNPARARSRFRYFVNK